MKPELIRKTRINKRLELTTKEKLKHYFLVFLTMIPGVIILYNLIWAGGRISFSNFINFWIGFLIILPFLLFIKLRLILLFREYKGKFSKSEIMEALERTSRELNWKISATKDDFFQAYGIDPIYKKKEDLITIIQLEKTIMINSIPNPSIISMSIFSGNRKNNIKTFVKHLKDVFEQKPENLDYQKPENEWTWKRIITRLVLYSFSILIVSMSIIVLLNPNKFSSGRFVGYGLILGIGYIVIDIKCILNRRKYERTTAAQKGMRGEGNLKHL